MKENKMQFLNGEIKQLEGESEAVTKIAGYASVFGNIDSHNDIIVKGAFSETIERIKERKINLYSSHSMDARDLLGTVTMLKEDDYGLYFEAEVSSAPSAQDIMLKSKEGHLDEISFGFYVTEQEFAKVDKKSVRLIKGIELVEISLVSRASNAKAKVLMVKEEVNSTSSEEVCKQEKTMEENKKNEDLEVEATEVKATEEVKAEKIEVKEEKSNEELLNIKQELAEMKELLAKPIRKTAHETGKVMEEKNELNVETKEQHAFVDFLSGRINKYEYHESTGLEAKALSAGTSADGGALIPTTLHNKIKQARQQINSIQKRVDSIVINGPFEIPKWDYSETFGAHTENGAIGVDDISSALSKPSLDANYFGAIVKISKKLLKRNQTEALEGFLASRYARKFEDQLENHIFNGTGTATPLGIIKYIDDNETSDGNTVALTASATLGNMDYDDVVDMVMILPEQYRSNAVIFGSKNFVKRVMKLKDSNSMPIWQPPVGDRPATLLGFPLIESPALEDGASANETVAVCCDPKEYILGTEEGFTVEVLRELYAGTNQIGLKMMAAYDGTPLDLNAFSRIETDS